MIWPTAQTLKLIGRPKNFIGQWDAANLLQVSRDGIWADGGEFPASLGSYVTIPKTNRGGSLRRERYWYLDAVHMDIAFAD